MKPQKRGLHPGRLTWNLRIHHWKRKIIFQNIIFRFYVNLQGCIIWNDQLFLFGSFFSLNEFWKVIGIYKPSRFVWGGDALLPGRFAHVCSRSPSKRIAMHVQHFLKVCYIRGIFSKSCLTGWFRCRFRNTCHDWHMLVTTILELAVTLEHLLLGSLYFFSIFCEETRLCSVYYVKRILKVDGFYHYCCNYLLIFLKNHKINSLRILLLQLLVVIFWTNYLLIFLKEAGDWCQIRFFLVIDFYPFPSRKSQGSQKTSFGAYHGYIYSHKETYA